MTTKTTVNAGVLIERAIIGLTGASLSLNAWLVKDKVSDMTDTLKEISAKLGELREEQAAVKNQVTNNTSAIAWLQRAHQHNKDN